MYHPDKNHTKEAKQKYIEILQGKGKRCILYYDWKYVAYLYYKSAKVFIGNMLLIFFLFSSAYDILKEKIKSFSGDELPKRADYTVEDCGEINSYRREAGSICSVGPINRFMCLKQLPNQTNTINQTILELNPGYCL